MCFVAALPYAAGFDTIQSAGLLLEADSANAAFRGFHVHPLDGQLLASSPNSGAHAVVYPALLSVSQSSNFKENST